MRVGAARIRRGNGRESEWLRVAIPDLTGPSFLVPGPLMPTISARTRRSDTPVADESRAAHTRTCAREIGRGRAAGSAAPGARRLTQPAQRRAALRLHAAPLGTGLHVRGRIEGLCGRD